MTGIVNWFGGRSVLDRMRVDWDRRAAEDAYYFAAFGRLGQTETEFFETAGEVLLWLRGERRHLDSHRAAAARFLEIGCGPGRLMRPLAAECREIHGVDVSDGMLKLARGHLKSVPNAFLHRNSGDSLADFESASFDFVYSYAVFQHIPAKEIVLQYLREATRVLRDGGVFTCQLNGLPQRGGAPTTWDGVQISSADVIELASDLECQLLALDGLMSQYMWFTWRKRPAGWRKHHKGWTGGTVSVAPDIPTIPVRQATSIWLRVTGLPDECAVDELRADIAGSAAQALRIGPREADNSREVSFLLAAPDGIGESTFRLVWNGHELYRGRCVVSSAVPSAPRIESITDGANYLSGEAIVSRRIKIITSNTPEPGKLRVAVISDPPSAFRAILKQSAAACIAKDESRYELNCILPEGMGPGSYSLRVCYGDAELVRTRVRIGLARFAIFGRPTSPGLLLDCKARCGQPGFLCRIARAGSDGAVSDMGTTITATCLLPFDDKSFDAIVCDWHATGDGANDFAKELARILKPDGMICLDSRTKASHASARRAGSLLPGRFRFARRLGISWEGQSDGKIFLRCVSIWNFLLHLAGASRLGGRAFFFGEGWLESGCLDRVNGCVGCWQSCHASELLRAGAVVALWMFNVYRCPECGTLNLMPRVWPQIRGRAVKPPAGSGRKP